MKVYKLKSITSILVIALLGANVVKISNDSIEYISVAEYNSAQGRAGLDTAVGGASEAGSGKEVSMNQSMKETLASSSTWWEYQSYKNSRMNFSYSNVEIQSAINYKLEKVDTPVTINGISTDEYYSVGVVFDIKGSPNAPKLEEWLAKMDGITNDNSSPFHAGEFYYSNETFGMNVENWSLAPTMDETNTDFYTGHEPTPDDLYYVKSDKWIVQPSYEIWHNSFDNDETTLFGASEYTPSNHVIFKFPVTTADPGSDWGYTRGGASTWVDDVRDDQGGHNKFHMNAISNVDSIALRTFELREGGNAYGDETGVWTGAFDDKKPDQYGRYDTGGYEANKDGIMLFSYPEPEFSVEPVGYNDDGNYEMKVIYDHSPVPESYDIIDSISYKLEGPTSKEDPTLTTWDEIILTDESFTRNHRDKVDDPTITTTTYNFATDEIPAYLDGWYDGYQGNGDSEEYGGAVQYDEETDSGIWVGGPNAAYGDGSSYRGDMQIGTDEALEAVITYDNLYYGNSEEDLDKEYVMSTEISLTPTELGREEIYLVDAPTDSLTTLTSQQRIILQPGPQEPDIDNFDVIKPSDVNSINPIEDEMQFHIAGDTKVDGEESVMKPTFLNTVQVIARELTDEGEVVMDGEDEVTIAISDMYQLDESEINSTNGTFDITLNSNDNLTKLKTFTNYELYLNVNYGDESRPSSGDSSLTVNQDINEEDDITINIKTGAYGMLDSNLTNVSTTLDGTGGLNISFDYSQSIPADYPGTLADWTRTTVKELKVYSTYDPETGMGDLIDTIDTTSFDSSIDQTGLSINVSADKIKGNHNYQPTIVIVDSKGDEYYGVSSTNVTTDPLGAFKPVLGNLSRNQETLVFETEGTKTDFTFTVKQQIGDKVDVSEYSASNMTSLKVEMFEDSVSILEQEYDVATLVDGNNTLDFTTDEYLFNKTSEYTYAITASYGSAEDADLLHEGVIDFSLLGRDEMIVEEDVIATTVASTPTTLSIDANIKDVSTLEGYDSYSVTNIELLDDNNTVVESEFVFGDEEYVRPEGVNYENSFSLYAKNIKAGTDLTNWKLRFYTDSVNYEGTTTLKTKFDYSLGELFTNSPGVINDDGNFNGSIDGDLEIMDIKPLVISSSTSVIDYENATFNVEIEDQSGIYSLVDIETFEVKTNNGNFSISNGNLLIEDITETRDGLITLELTLDGLTEGVEYQLNGIDYMIYEENSSSIQTIDTSGLSFTTKTHPDTKSSGNFPWWIFILLIIVGLIGAGLFLVWFFLLNNKYKVVETVETKKGSLSFRVNEDNDFASSIEGRPLVGTQDGTEKELTFTKTGDVFKLTGITNTTNVTKLTFKANAASNSELVKLYESELSKWETAKAKHEEKQAKLKEEGKETTKFEKEKPSKPKLEKDIVLSGKAIAIIPEEKPSEDKEAKTTTKASETKTEPKTTPAKKTTSTAAKTTTAKKTTSTATKK